MKIIAALILFLGCAVPVCAQEYTVVTSTDALVDNGSGTAINPPSGSSLCFLGVNNQGAAITYTPSGGSPVTGPVCQTYNGSGALTGALQVANAATASPFGLCYTITIADGSTTYLSIPTVCTVNGSLFSLDSFSLPGNGSALGIGYAHLSCNNGATWTSTTLPAGQDSQTCNSSRAWIGYPPNNYCPAGMAYNVPQSGGKPFCSAPLLSANGAPTGTCLKNSFYSQQDSPSVYFCESGTWTEISTSGAGITSFQGRTTPAATLQASDLTGLLANAPFSFSGSQGLAFDTASGTPTPSTNWVLGTGASAGQLYGYQNLNLAPSSGASNKITLNAATGAATFGGGTASISASGVGALAASSTVGGQSICLVNGTNCPTSTAGTNYQTIQNNTVPVTQRAVANYVTTTGIVATDDSGNASTDISLAGIPNSSLANDSVVINSQNCVLGSNCSITATGVTSVGLALPANTFSVDGSPVTGSGTLTGAFVSQSANTFFAGPTSGSAAAPTWRAITAADIPTDLTGYVQTNPTLSALPQTITTPTGALEIFNILDSSGAPVINLLNVETEAGIKSQLLLQPTGGLELGGASADFSILSPNSNYQGLFFSDPYFTPSATINSGSSPSVSINADDMVYFADASAQPLTITIPSAAIGQNGRQLLFKKIDSSANTVTISPASGTIDGASNLVLSAQNAAVWLDGDGTNLHIVAAYSPSSGMVYPGAGIPVSTGSAWSSSLTKGGTGTTVPTVTGSFASGNLVELTGTAGEQQDSGIASSNVPLLSAANTFTNVMNVQDNFYTLASGTATSSNNYPAYPITQTSSYWTGSAAATDSWGWGVTIGAGANPTTEFYPQHTGSSGTASVLIPFPTTINGTVIPASSTLCTTATGCHLVANTTTTVGTTAISANTCTSATTATMTGLTTSMTLNFTPASDISGVTGWSPSASGVLYIVAWPTANTLNYKVCNPTAASITPGSSVTFNVGAR